MHVYIEYHPGIPDNGPHKDMVEEVWSKKPNWFDGRQLDNLISAFPGHHPIPSTAFILVVRIQLHACKYEMELPYSSREAILPFNKSNDIIQINE